MKARRSFLGRLLGVGAGAVVVSKLPAVIQAAPEAIDAVSYKILNTVVDEKAKRVRVQVRFPNGRVSYVFCPWTGDNERDAMRMQTMIEDGVRMSQNWAKRQRLIVKADDKKNDGAFTSPVLRRLG